MNLQFNNKKQVSPVGLLLSFIFLSAVVCIGLYYLILDERIQSLEIGAWIYLLLSGLVFYFGGFCYVEVEASEQRIDVKYYNLFPFGRQYKRILLPVDKIKKIKLAKGIGPIGRRLVISGVVNGRLALFPSVGLGACNAQQIDKLNAYIKSIKHSN
ncbi:hypothetical protein [Carboxylicivirga sp. N1Y90]|uniref:hypothetical protein n=1 Tax=Carboxylicivirga fragile TaxID=3417571 RepID=UPI003D33A920|nr:hypothetical protein [Marinilabiliaceae bacterium N1Y90]